MNIGDRVKVVLRVPETYAHGAAAALNGKTGVLEEFKQSSINGDDGGPAFVVAFDTPAEVWSKWQTPPTKWWFPPGDLVLL